MGIRPDQLREMEERLERNRKIKLPVRQQAVTPVPPSPVSTETTDLIFACLDRYDTREFTYFGKPVGKPRMTNRDRFMKRPIVMRYWQFAGNLRAAAGILPPSPDMVLITAWVPMPESWTRKKKESLNGQPCRQRPDWDNIGKAVCDALFEEDCCIWVGSTIKYWCCIGDERLDVKVLYAKS